MGWKRPQGSGTKPPAAMPGTRCRARPVVVRYADDLVVCCSHPGSRPSRSRPSSPSGWHPGVLSSTRTRPRSCTSSEGFDFLGFNVRRYRNGKLLIKPSPAAVKRLRKTARGRDARACAARTRRRSSPHSPRSSGAGPPTTGGWCPARSSTRWTTTCGSSPTGGPNAPTPTSRRGGSSDRYFGRFNKFRNDKWVFGNRAGVDEHGSVPHLIKFAWTAIVRHQMVTGTASPDDPDLVDYWASPAATGQTPAGQLQPAPAHQAGRSLSALPGPPAHRRPATPVPTGMGTLVAERGPPGDRRRLPRPPGRTRHAGQQPNPLDTRLLPPRAPRLDAQFRDTPSLDPLSSPR